jgi:hypothetical protein
MPQVDGVDCHVWDRLAEAGWDDYELVAMLLRWLGYRGLLQEWLAQIDNKANREVGEGTRRTRSVEYYRCWAGNNGDSGTWDTVSIDVPADTPEDKLEEAVREAVAKIDWRDGEAPVIVGLYCANDDEEEIL